MNKGQVVARLRLTAGRDRLVAAERKLSSLRQQRAQLVTYWAKYLPAQQASIELQRSTTQKILQDANESVTAAKSELDATQTLFNGGLTTKTRLDQVRQNYFEAVARRDDLAVKAKGLDSQTMALTSQRDQALNQIDLSIIEAESDVTSARDTLDEARTVIALETGRVTEIEVNPGDNITADTHILTISYGDPALSAVIYIPATSGESIKPGMVARIMPSTVRTDEYGTVIGQVVSVSPYPASQASIQRQLNDTDLARDFLQSGPRIEVRVDLASDPSTPSGLKWSSGRGPSTLVREGALAGADVTVREQPPASLVIPALRRLLGLSSSAG